MSSTATATKWNKEPSHTPGNYTRQNLIVIDDSLWYSSDYNEDTKGMTEYSIKSHKIIQTIPYPQQINPYWHCCVLCGSTIYIIDGYNGSIIAFNPKSKTFTKKQFIPKIGKYPNAVVISNTIRIFYGRDNDKYDIVYDTINNAVKPHKTQHSEISPGSSIFYQNKIISIGGFDYTKSKRLDTVRISQTLNNDELMKWTIKQQWKLPKGLYFFGCVVYNNYVLLFGGDNGSYTYQDAIYLLDLNGDDKWQKLKHIKCPIPGRYVAALSPDNHVHLFLGHNTDYIKGHYELPITSILGSEFMVNIEEESKYSEDDELRSKLESSQKLINDLIKDKEIEENKSKQELSKLIKQNDEYSTKYQQSLSTINELKQREITSSQQYKQEINQLKSKLKQVQNDHDAKDLEIIKLSQQLTESKKSQQAAETKAHQELAKLVKEKNEYIAKYQQSQSQNDEHKQEIDALKSQIIQKESQILTLSQQLKESQAKEMALSEECKEKTMELMEVRKELKDMKRKHIDTTQFMNWNADEFLDWICGLENGKYAQYEGTLREAFKNEAIDGSAIPDIDKNDWKGWGIQIFKDRTAIHKHVQALKNQNMNNNNNNDNDINVAAAAPAYNEGGNKTEYH